MYRINRSGCLKFCKEIGFKQLSFRDPTCKKETVIKLQSDELKCNPYDSPSVYTLFSNFQVFP